MGNRPNIVSPWKAAYDQFSPDDIVSAGTSFMTGNGYLGYRGTFPEWRAREYAACIVSDTYDMADGTWKELCSIPNALVTKTELNSREVSLHTGAISGYVLGIDTSAGITYGSYQWEQDSHSCGISFSRFAHLEQIHTIPQRIVITPDCSGELKLTTGIDGDVWSLHGDHFSSVTPRKYQQSLAAVCITAEKGLEITCSQHCRISGAVPSHISVIHDDRSLYREYTIPVTAGTPVIIEQVMSVHTIHDVSSPLEHSLQHGSDASAKGFDQLLLEQKTAWSREWQRFDITLEDEENSEDQLLFRFNSYHQRIATPSHTDHLPIGARGLSCQAYQGAAFWDQEIFNLPMYIHTDPDIARKLLTYRYKTLDGARKKAKRLGYSGAFYAWVSGDTGDELCPDYFFREVITGRPIRNHFNDWQIHISPDIAYAVLNYYRITGDWEFMTVHGAEMLCEISRFLFSRSSFRKDRNRYDILRVLGPDEYHENVDNNAFTNYQARYVLQGTLDILSQLEQQDPQMFRMLQQRLKLSSDEYIWWQEMTQLLYLPPPNESTGFIEQFQGYFALEDASPEELTQRLLDPQEYWGAPIGVAQDTQVIKQADVIQLFVLHTDLFSREVMEKCYRYYEPRTHHRSSLSPAVHAIAAARLGMKHEAFRYFRTAAAIDLYSTHAPVSGGTFIGGIHTAACGAIWQTAVFGFAGYRADDASLSFDPLIPEAWKTLSFRLAYRGQGFHARISNSFVTVTADKGNTRSLVFSSGESRYTLEPGKILTYTPR